VFCDFSRLGAQIDPDKQIGIVDLSKQRYLKSQKFGLLFASCSMRSHFFQAKSWKKRAQLQI
jgi:hypothetical protein